MGDRIDLAARDLQRPVMHRVPGLGVSEAARVLRADLAGHALHALIMRGGPDDKSAAIAKEAAATGKTIREMAKLKTDLSDAELDRLLDPETMTEPGLGAGA